MDSRIFSENVSLSFGREHGTSPSGFPWLLVIPSQLLPWSFYFKQEGHSIRPSYVHLFLLSQPVIPNSFTHTHTHTTITIWPYLDTHPNTFWILSSLAHFLPLLLLFPILGMLFQSYFARLTLAHPSGSSSNNDFIYKHSFYGVIGPCSCPCLHLFMDVHGEK